MPPAKTTTARPATASDMPRTIGLVLSVLLGLLMATIGVAGAGKTQILLTLVHFGVAALMLWLAWKAWNRSRAAWAFLISINAVLVVHFIFGAPTFVKVLGVSLPLAMFPAFLFAVATIALASARRDYTT
jgi:cell shape-determining protein MreD